MTRTRCLAAALILGLALVLGVRTDHGPKVAEALGPISLQQVGSGFAQPLGIVSAGDGRLFIIEQSGRIKILNGGTTLPTPFLDVSALMPAFIDSEQGLLGLAFHPNFPATPYFYIDYTNDNEDIVVARYSVSANPNIANAAGVVMLTIPHPAANNHNGGQLNFGPDGYLYVAVGDGGGGGDPNNNAQNKNILLGKILRLDVNRHELPVTLRFQ